MLDSKKIIRKLKPMVYNFSKKSGVAAKKLFKLAKNGQISKEKVKNIIRALDESEKTRKWMRAAMIALIAGFIFKKVIEVYDEEKSFRQNVKSLVAYFKKMKKRIRGHGC